MPQVLDSLRSRVKNRQSLIIGEILEESEHILMWFVEVLPTERGVVKEESCAQ